ncbi:biotin--[acetyl-CoA-carboxylase] ligase [Marinirhabdus gelatinilytica]|uniref:BirA family biotin operon repressor/biotin-[acetyl-CoA-carboxylase] ligase n=1 Tax=Marinirhabdus gelatinilytica TaxID=1703343 RepID=A0A370Q8I9_9FLAO|nr:biotin--[acetyl-CoA-carboxylase] ligase [Marinirhabdus gelatinilytica]RDK84692.1 BirA family biotin operon repressor/biotin-[acetyl-CoA-carboxylase] ligase [Marinirhabdus gelatinilytica]
MDIIKLNAIPSTNSYLRELVARGQVGDELVVTATTQQEGRGQHGSVWQSQAGKSLACSLFKRFSGLRATEQFLLNMLVSQGVVDALKVLEIPKVAIKWPNDIMSQGKKVAGILIENQLKGSEISSGIIGIGLNVNETFFEGLPQASSLKLITGKTFTIDEVVHTVATLVFERLKGMPCATFGTVQQDYHDLLFKRNVVSTFQTEAGLKINGIILGVSPLGKLRVSHEDDTIVEYGLKEIKLLF